MRLGDDGGWLAGQGHAPAFLPPAKEHGKPLYRGLGGPMVGLGGGGEDKVCFPHRGSNPELSRL
jgi:hypothetical protein